MPIYSSDLFILQGMEQGAWEAMGAWLSGLLEFASLRHEHADHVDLERALRVMEAVTGLGPIFYSRCA